MYIHIYIHTHLFIDSSFCFEQALSKLQVLWSQVGLDPQTWSEPVRLGAWVGQRILAVGTSS